MMDIGGLGIEICAVFAFVSKHCDRYCRITTTHSARILCACLNKFDTTPAIRRVYRKRADEFLLVLLP